MTDRAKRSFMIAVLLVILIAAVTFSIYLAFKSKSATSAGWGQGRLKTSERAYYMSRMEKIIRQWQQTAKDAQQDKDGRLEKSYDVYLVIDMKQPAIWIEKNGVLQQENHSELTRGMKWKLYYSGPQSDREIGDKIRLKARGVYTSQIFPETIYLAGEGQGRHQSFNFNSNSFGSSNGTGSFDSSPYTKNIKSKDEDNDYYRSIVVSDAEYEQHLTSLAGAPSDQTSGEVKLKQSPLDENRSNWVKVRKKLYQQIDVELMRKGLDLTNLKVMIGPDYTAGHAKFRVKQSGVIKKFFNPVLIGGASYLKFDYLGEDIWYFKSSTHPLHPMMEPWEIGFEFLVCATNEIADTERITWLDKGRDKQLPVTQSGSKWQVTLANGVEVEFMGICENPSAGKQWWGPDGSALDYAPCYNEKIYGRRRNDRRVFEIVWKVKFPGNGTTTSSLEGAMGSYRHQTFDKYGYTLHDISAGGYGFEKTREKTTFKAGFKIGSGEYEWVRFKNISLERGKDFGFEILRGEE